MTDPTTDRLASPDLFGRPHQLSVERIMRATSAAIYRAWTEEFDSWFATPGAIRMRLSEDEPFYFEVLHQGRRHPHYGRFLTLEPDRLIELTWVTGKDGTEGAETVVRVQLTTTRSGTLLQLTHSGFSSPQAVTRHRDAWPVVLTHLDDQLTATA